MAEFMLWPRAAALSLTLLFALAVLIQSLTMAVSFYRHPHGRPRLAAILPELLILCYIIACSLLHGEAVQGYEAGILPPALPILDSAAGGAFGYLYVLSILFFLIRGILVIRIRLRRLRSRLSALSVKNAVDSLPAGIMFCEEDGFALLINTKMRRLMAAITNKSVRNGRAFYSRMTLGQTNPGYCVSWLNGQLVCELPDGSAWLFAMNELMNEQAQIPSAYGCGYNRALEADRRAQLANGGAAAASKGTGGSDGKFAAYQPGA